MRENVVSITGYARTHKILIISAHCKEGDTPRHGVVSGGVGKVTMSGFNILYIYSTTETGGTPCVPYM
jgi:hypothetical protein